jgi:hypothetical protein
VHFYYRCPEPHAPSPEELSRDVGADAGFLYDKPTVLSAVIKKIEITCVKSLRTFLNFRFRKTVFILRGICIVLILI